MDPLGDPSPEITASVRAWVTAWGAEVAAVDLTGARDRFDPGVVAFGTFADVVHGIDQLHDDQWSNIWPVIADFSFRVDELEVLASPDGALAVAVVPWDSTGTDGDGARFPRPGRATVVLARRGEGDRWRGVHTHFSLAPSGRQR